MLLNLHYYSKFNKLDLNLFCLYITFLFHVNIFGGCKTSCLCIYLANLCYSDCAECITYSVTYYVLRPCSVLHIIKSCYVYVIHSCHMVTLVCTTFCTFFVSCKLCTSFFKNTLPASL